MTRLDKAMAWAFVLGFLFVIFAGSLVGQEPDSITVIVTDTSTTGLVVVPADTLLDLRPGDVAQVSGVIVDAATGEPVTDPSFEIRWFSDSEYVEVDAVTGEVVALPLQGNRRIRALVWGEVVYVSPPPPVEPPDTTPPPVEPPVGAIFFDDFGDAAGACGWTGRPAGEPGHASSSSQPALDFEGNCALRFSYPATPDLGNGDSDSWLEHRVWLGGRYKDVWVAYDWYVPENYCHRNAVGSDNNKWIRFFTGDGNPPTFAITMETGTHAAAPNCGTSYLRRFQITGQWFGSEWQPADQTVNTSQRNNMVGPGTLMSPGWHRIGHRISLSSAYGETDGRLETWVDGVLIRALDWPLWNTDGATPGMDLFYLMGWSNSGWNERTTFWIDNLEIHLSDPGWGS